MRLKWVHKIAVLAVLYWLVGHASMQFMVEPEKALPFFPPAGIALAALLCFGRNLWPGIFIAGLFFNMHNFSSPGAENWLYSTGLLPAFLMATGATLQALAAEWILRHYKIVPGVLESFESIVRFLLLAGPLCCVVSASFAVCAMSLAFNQPLSSFYFDWFAWWAGDALGVVIFASAGYLIFNPSKDVFRVRKWVMAVTIVILSFFTLWLFDSVEQERKTLFRHEFHKLSENLHRAIDGQLKSISMLLQSYVAYFNGSGYVSPQEFKQFTDEVIKEAVGLRGIGWAPYLLHKDRAALEERMNAEHWVEGFKVTEKKEGQGMIRAPKRDFYVPVQYIEPYKKNEAAFGFNLASHPGRRHTIETTRDTGGQTATEPIKLVQEKGSKISFLMMAPVYQVGENTDTLELKREHFEGVISSVFDVNSLLDSVLDQNANYAKGVGLYVIDKTNEEPVTIYGLEPANKDDYEFAVSRIVGGRKWELYYYPQESYLKKNVFASLTGTIGMGLSINSLLVALVLVVGGRADTVQRMVQERTEELNKQKEELERSNKELDDFAYIASHDLKEPLRGIQGFASIIEDEYKDKLDDDGREYLRLISDLGRKANLQVKTLLTYSQLGRMELDKKTIDVVELIDEVKSSLSASIKDQKAVVRTVGVLPDTVVSDHTLLKSIFQNLIDNGIKYNQSESKNIEISYHMRTKIKTVDGEETVEDVFCVRDNGIGVPDKFQKSIFVIFKRLHTDKEYESGSGAGLTIVMKAVQRLGGEIYLESEPGKGSAFYFRIES